MSEKQPKLKFEEEKERTATRSPPKKSKVEQSVPKKQKLKQDADKAAEKSQHLRFGKAEITPDEASRMTKQQKRAMYAAAAARSAGCFIRGDLGFAKTQVLRPFRNLICIGFQLFLSGHRLLHLGFLRGRTGLFCGRFLFDDQFRFTHFCAPSEISLSLVVRMR